MRWQDRKRSSNVEDRRGESVPGGGGRGMGVAGGLGIGRLLFSLFSRGNAKTKIFLVIGVIVAMFAFGINPLSMLGFGGSSSNNAAQVEQAQPAPDDQHKAFISSVLGANERAWKDLFPKAYNKRFKPAKLIIYTQRTRLGDGNLADAGMGPFYYPADNTIYLDPTFFTEMEQQFNAPGDFARAYVIAHEFGHHLQHLLGRTTQLHSMQGKVSKKEYNRASVRLELHADFLAGIFAHHDDKNFNSLERGDIQEAMTAAKAIGDDRLQKQAGGRVRPDHFTHGTSEQRSRWFMAGYTSGNPLDGEQIFSMDYNKL